MVHGFQGSPNQPLSSMLLPPPSRSFPSPRAFTLVEVILALVIFGLAATVLASAYLNVLIAFQSMDRQQATEEDLRAVYRLVLNTAERDDFEAGGILGMPVLGDVRWQARLEPLEIAELFTATVELEWQTEEDRDRQRSERTFSLFRPGWGTPDEIEPRRQATRERLLQERAMGELR